MSGNFEFQYPWVLGPLALLPIYALLHGRPGKLAALRFPSADIARAAGASARAAVGRLLLFLRLLVLALLIGALAGPRFANDHTETEASGIDIMLVLDVSWSMMALDMGSPSERVSRFDIASDVLEDFVRKRPSDRLGLIVFSAVPYLASPLTLNHDWLIENLHRLHVGLIRDLGTAIGDATVAGARKDGEVRTLWGRKRALPDITSRNPGLRQAAERMAVNTPIQGTAADVVKIAMLRVDAALRATGLDARLLLQVHDELVLEVALGDRGALEELLRREMPAAAKLAVPLEVEVGHGASWAEAH